MGLGHFELVSSTPLILMLPTILYRRIAENTCDNPPLHPCSGATSGHSGLESICHDQGMDTKAPSVHISCTNIASPTSAASTSADREIVARSYG